MRGSKPGFSLTSSLSSLFNHQSLSQSRQELTAGSIRYKHLYVAFHPTCYVLYRYRGLDVDAIRNVTI